MTNTWIVAKREFMTRALKKKFLLITLFMPLIIAIFSGSLGVIMSYKSDSQVKLILKDSTQIIPADVQKWNNLVFTRDSSKDDDVIQKLENGYDGVLILPPISSDLESIVSVLGYKTSAWLTSRQI